jgi:hypothetical protein
MAGKAEVARGFTTSLEQLLNYFSSLGEKRGEFVSVHLTFCTSSNVPEEIIQYTKHKLTLPAVFTASEESKNLAVNIPLHSVRETSFGGALSQSFLGHHESFSSGGSGPMRESNEGSYGGGSEGAAHASQGRLIGGQTTHGLLVEVRKEGGGYLAKFSNGKTIKFGTSAKTFIDYSKENEVLAKQKKIAFLKKNKNELEAFSPDTLIRMLLWNKPSLKESIYDYNTMFY